MTYISSENNEAFFEQLNRMYRAGDITNYLLVHAGSTVALEPKSCYPITRFVRTMQGTSYDFAKGAKVILDTAHKAFRDLPEHTSTTPKERIVGRCINAASCLLAINRLARCVIQKRKNGIFTKHNS